jgi:hypothetical protein
VLNVKNMTHDRWQIAFSPPSNTSTLPPLNKLPARFGNAFHCPSRGSETSYFFFVFFFSGVGLGGIMGKGGGSGHLL